ncbi:hypothetical protein [Vallitalea okinawensis]|uniref:hypothetical protein n=1 Tax=Vallitalea okinawensis TaxID=2078660 RepID=UPI000CFD5023|nr:hypothetical protein [Vallitalea okinawensis]
MKFSNFKEYEKAYTEQYIKKDYEGVIDLLNHGKDLLPQEEYEKNLFIIMLDKARIYTEIPDYKKCISTFMDMTELGFACPLVWKRFEPLKKEERYDELIEKNDLLLEEAKKKAEFKYEVHLPEGYSREKKYPLFLNLHGDGSDGNIEEHSWYWKPEALVKEGFIVVYPQSSQVYCYNGFGWLIDPEVARKEIRTCYEEIARKYSIDNERIIIGGFSGGSMAAADITMYNVIPVRGFVSLCPGEELKTFNKKHTEDAKKRGIKGVIIEGENEIEPTVQEVIHEFDEVGFTYQYHIMDGVGHWYPDDLDERVNKALEFILE